jgi:hypothetical protein
MTQNTSSEGVLTLAEVAERWNLLPQEVLISPHALPMPRESHASAFPIQPPAPPSLPASSPSSALCA